MGEGDTANGSAHKRLLVVDVQTVTDLSKA